MVLPVEAVTLSDLGPIIAAVVGPMLVLVAASMRYQHVDSTKTRKLITDSEKATLTLVADSNEKNRDLIADSNKETRELIEKNRDLIAASNKETRELIEKNRDLIMRNHEAIGEVRERLARIEGHLGIPPQQTTSDDGDAEAT